MNRLIKLTLGEPYRVFFPLGLLAGIWGVMMWPLHYGGHLFYPGEAHTRIMTECFMGAFVLGFIGTAYPRLTGNKHWFAGEFFFLLLLWFLVLISHSRGHVAAGDAAFTGLMAVLFIGMIARWISGNKDTPPPGFVLAFPGIIGAAASAWALSRPDLGYCATEWARLWLFQGFLLLPLMGIGPYLLPRFFGHPSNHSFDDSRTPPPGWWSRAIRSAVAGLLVIASFALEIHGHPLAGQLSRAAIILVWFAIETPVFRRALTPSTPANAVRLAVVGLTAGCACAAFWPPQTLQSVGSMHLLYASGLGLVTIIVGTRVILGHAGRHDLLTGKLIWLRWVAGLLILAAATRMSADFILKIRVSHLNYAAFSWAAGSIIWMTAIAKYLFREDDDGKPKKKCPRRKN